jgi:hypothetical protein
LNLQNQYNDLNVGLPEWLMGMTRTISTRYTRYHMVSAAQVQILHPTKFLLLLV